MKPLWISCWKSLRNMFRFLCDIKHSSNYLVCNTTLHASYITCPWRYVIVLGIVSAWMWSKRPRPFLRGELYHHCKHMPIQCAITLLIKCCCCFHFAVRPHASLVFNVLSVNFHRDCKIAKVFIKHCFVCLQLSFHSLHCPTICFIYPCIST